jgi:2-haloalkanoic acid dehalogenase type II
VNSEIKAVFFDLDDTLCAYWSASRRALRQAVDEASLDVPTDTFLDAWREVFTTFSKEIKTDKWYAHYLESGEPTRTEHIRRAFDLLRVDVNGEAERLSHRYNELRNQYLLLFPESLSVLTHLKRQFKMGLITNGPADVQRQEIAALGIGHFFDHIYIEGEFKLGKPYPEIFDAGRIALGLTPKEMLFVGNAFEHDVQGAKNAGWHALWINRGDEIDPGTSPRPDAVISDLREVCDWLGIDRPIIERETHSVNLQQ